MAATIDDRLAKCWKGFLSVDDRVIEFCITVQQGSESAGAAVLHITNLDAGEAAAVRIDQITASLRDPQTGAAQEGPDAAVGHARQHQKQRGWLHWPFGMVGHDL